jgi:hypothetical protein
MFERVHESAYLSAWVYCRTVAGNRTDDRDRERSCNVIRAVPAITAEHLGSTPPSARASTSRRGPIRPCARTHVCTSRPTTPRDAAAPGPGAGACGRPRNQPPLSPRHGHRPPGCPRTPRPRRARYSAVQRIWIFRSRTASTGPWPGCPRWSWWPTGCGRRGPAPGPGRPWWVPSWRSASGGAGEHGGMVPDRLRGRGSDGPGRGLGVEPVKRQSVEVSFKRDMKGRPSGSLKSGARLDLLLDVLTSAQAAGAPDGANVVVESGGSRAIITWEEDR